MTGKTIIIFLLLINFVLKMDKIKSDLDALEGNIVLSDSSEDSDNWEPLRKSEGPETVLDDSDTDEDYAVPDGAMPSPPRQNDPDKAGPETVPRLSSRAVPLPAVSKCYWWPFCTSDTSICNGYQKSLCSVYGRNGSKLSEAPSDVALARAVARDRKWKQSFKDRICSWGCGRVVLCGGVNQASCEKYGTNGTHKHLRPPKNESKELVEELKKQKKRRGWRINVPTSLPPRRRQSGRGLRRE